MRRRTTHANERSVSSPSSLVSPLERSSFFYEPDALVPAVLEIPAAGHPYDVHKDGILRHADFVSLEDYI